LREKETHNQQKFIGFLLQRPYQCFKFIGLKTVSVFKNYEFTLHACHNFKPTLIWNSTFIYIYIYILYIYIYIFFFFLILITIFVHVIFSLATWQPPFRLFSSPVTCNKAKTHRGLAGGASFDAQVNWESERERVII